RAADRPERTAGPQRRLPGGRRGPGPLHRRPGPAHRGRPVPGRGGRRVRAVDPVLLRPLGGGTGRHRTGPPRPGPRHRPPGGPGGARVTAADPRTPGPAPVPWDLPAPYAPAGVPLVDLLDRVLATGVVVSGDLVLAIADVPAPTLTDVELLRQLMERQAVRRFDEGTVSSDQ